MRTNKKAEAERFGLRPRQHAGNQNWNEVWNMMRRGEKLKPARPVEWPKLGEVTVPTGVP